MSIKTVEFVVTGRGDFPLDMLRYDFAEFYRAPGQPGVGDRSVIILDGRMSRHNMVTIARVECKKRGYNGFRIRYGTFLDSIDLSGYQTIYGDDR